jgi:hypothetical protein
VRLGDLIEWGGQRWIVRRMERATRTAIICDIGQRSEVLPDNLDTTKPGECQIIANPSDDWPFVTLAQRPKYGKLLRIARPDLGGAATDLVALQDWVMTEPTQPGGALFFNPMLNLRTGDMLLAIYERGRGRVQIPREFLSTAGKKARAEAPPDEAPRLSVYDRLKRNDYEDD